MRTPLQSSEMLSNCIPLQVVQREWEQTLHRLREVCEITAANPVVNWKQAAHLVVHNSSPDVVPAVERILMDNLLFALWSRTERQHEMAFAGEWLTCWRRAVPWRCEKVGGMARLAPGTPQHQWTYRFNIIEVDA